MYGLSICHVTLIMEIGNFCGSNVSLIQKDGKGGRGEGGEKEERKEREKKEGR